MAITPEQQEFIAQYTAKKGTYDKLAKTLEKILKSIAKEYDPLAIVSARSKGISSFAEKIIKKNKYKNPLIEVTDLAGARIIVHFPNQVKRACEFIKTHFEIDEVNSFDHRNNLKIGEFGYRSIHYIVTLNRNEINGIPIEPEVCDLKAEIQVRTFLEHNWADIGHDRLYKTSIKVPEKWNREAARLAAIMENAESKFTLMAHTLDSFSAGFRVNYTPQTLEEECEKLSTLIKLEDDSEEKLLNLLKLCNIFALQARWNDLIKNVESHMPDLKKEPSLFDRINAEKYYAELMIHPDISSTEYDNLVCDLRATVKRLERNSLGEDELEDNFIKVFATAKAYSYLGQAYVKNILKKREARECFNNAHKLVPNDPYYFIQAVVFELINCKIDMVKHMLQLLTPQLENAAKQCSTHIEIGANGALAYTTMGRIFYLLGLNNKALSAYTKAVDLILHEKTLISNEYLWEEFEMFESFIGLTEDSKKTQNNNDENVENCNALSNEEKDVSNNEAEQTLNKDLAYQIQLLICLALMAKDRDKKAIKYLENEFEFKKRDNVSFKKNVLIVAGGAEGLDPTKVKKYQEYVSQALCEFEGIVISGGTKSGIPGIVGIETEVLKRHKSKNFELFGYLPQGTLPSDAEKDPSYEPNITYTSGKGFSVLELLNYWYDILASNPKQPDVIVLGINGGQISDLEYKLALAFGAKVGLITSSGRAVADLMLDTVWNTHPDLLSIPDDPCTVWALVNHSKPTKISRGKISKMARAIHKNYRLKSLNKKSFKSTRTDVDYFKPLMDWNHLDPKLKESNIHQACLLEHMLKKVECSIEEVESVPKGAIIIRKLEETSEISRELAPIEHARWNAERLRAGWRLASEKNIDKKLSPYLDSWKNLDPDTQDYDFGAVEAFPEILQSVGYIIIDNNPDR